MVSLLHEKNIESHVREKLPPNLRTVHEVSEWFTNFDGPGTGRTRNQTAPRETKVFREEMKVLSDGRRDDERCRYQISSPEATVRVFFVKNGRADTAPIDEKRHKCYFCGKLGHFKKECWNRKKVNSSTTQADLPVGKEQTSKEARISKLEAELKECKKSLAKIEKFFAKEAEGTAERASQPIQSINSAKQKNSRCYYCGKKGHLKSQCRIKIQNEQHKIKCE